MSTEASRFFDLAMVSFDELLGSYGSKEFNSPTRSTIPLLSLVRHEEGMLNDILADCHVAGPPNLHFEFTVKPRFGRGEPSHTDIMVFSATHCLAVEAKWTEPPYETVADWLKRSNTQEKQTAERNNREQVLSSWVELLNAHGSIASEEVAHCEYQMLHRAASARAAAGSAGRRPLLAYFKFIPSGRSASATLDYYREGLELLSRRLCNPAEFPFFLVEIKITPTDKFREIQHLRKGDTLTGRLVRNALRHSRLFEFDSYHVTRIGGTL